MENTLFRARGKYKGTGRDVWLTKSWATNEEAAKRDIDVMRHSFTDTRIIKKNSDSFFDEINIGKRKRLPMRHIY